MQNEPIRVTLKVTNVLERLGVPYLIGGSLASALYGMVRATQDSDIVAEMRFEHIRPFVASLQSEFYLDKNMIAESIQRHSSFNLIHHETIFKVDVFTPLLNPFLQSQLARAQVVIFEEASARFASPEDTILSKLEWYRRGGETSERQWRDVLGVLKTRAGELDIDYLLKWAKELSVSDILDGAISEAA